MRHFTLVLTALLLAAGLASAGDGIQLRYHGLSGPASLTVEQEILLRLEDPVEARRSFSFDLTPAAQAGASTAGVTIDSARADSMAHGASQRLGTRHLKGRLLPLEPADGGRRLEASAGGQEAVIDLGPILPGGVPPAALVAGSLPELPGEAITEGATWTTRREIRTLEGWSWATARLTSHHRVVSVERRAEGTIVTVATEAEADLGPVPDGRAYSGKLERTSRWSFDASSGRLLSLTLDQETEGLSDLKTEGTPVHQVTRVRLAPRGPGGDS